MHFESSEAVIEGVDSNLEGDSGFSLVEVKEEDHEDTSELSLKQSSYTNHKDNIKGD